MSLSRPITQNPAVRFYEWSGSRGQLEYYDKDKAERIAIPLPFKFIVLDELHTITGYSDQDQSGYWSNEVRRTSDDLTVRAKRGVKYVGPYKNSQGIRQVPTDSKYAKSIYIAHKLDGEWKIGNIKASGVALTSWIDLSGKHRTEGNITAITGSTDGSKGATTFQIPTFEYGGAPDGETLQIATELDAKLQDYLDTYLTAPKYDDHAEPVYEDNTLNHTELATPEQIAKFEELKSAKLADKLEDRAIHEQVEDITNRESEMSDEDFLIHTFLAMPFTGENSLKQLVEIHGPKKGLELFLDLPDVKQRHYKHGSADFFSWFHFDTKTATIKDRTGIKSSHTIGMYKKLWREE